jgi:hypothetical protein
VPAEFGIAVFLAENDVDVWGIDQAWTLVPEETSDFGFMAEWGLQRQVDDLNFALFVARFSRLLSGNGLKKILLSGYSSGTMTGYALLNQETQRPQTRRQVNGYIPIDMAIKTNDEPFRQFMADRAVAFMDSVNSGTPQEFLVHHLVSQLASSDPGGASPVIPGFTNEQTAIFLGIGPIWGVVPFHYLAGTWDGPIPTGFQFAALQPWLEALDAVAFYEPYRFRAEWAAVLGDEQDLPFDDYWSQIEVPIFNVGAAGGMGNYSAYGTTFLGSTDITHLNIQLQSSADVAIDFGHVDIFVAVNAPTLVWQPMLSWIKSH